MNAIDRGKMEVNLSNRSTVDNLGDRMEIGEPGENQAVMELTEAGEIEVISLEDIGPTSSGGDGGPVAMDTVNGDAEMLKQSRAIHSSKGYVNEMDQNDECDNDEGDESLQLGDLEMRLANRDDSGDESGDDVEIDDDLMVGSTRPSSSRSYVVGGELNVGLDSDDEDENARAEVVQEYTISSLTPRERFKKAGRQVKFMCGVQLSLNKCAEEAGKGTFSIQIADLLEKMSRTPSVIYMPENSTEKLSFNATDFRSKYEFTWPEKARLILDKAPSERDPEDIRVVRSLMRGLHSFRKYSRQLQDLICKVIRYAKYGRRRVVIRKGHPGFSFYFIFSGMAGVTLEEDEMHAFVKKEVNILRKGASFGEIALVKDSRRKATVVCLEDTEFLVVDSDNFYENNLHLHIQHDFEYRLQFLSRMDLFSTWSKEMLGEISDMGRIEEYCNQATIVKDARDTDWLFIITKGRADVLKLVDLAKLYRSKQAEENEVIQISRRNRVLSGRGSVWNEDVTSRFMQPHALPQQPQPFPWLSGGGDEDGAERQQTRAKDGKKTDRAARPKTTGQIASRIHKPGSGEDESEVELGERKVRSKSATVRLKIPVKSELRYSDDDSDDDGDFAENGVSMSHSTNPQLTFCEPPEGSLPEHITLGLDTIRTPGVEAGVYIQVDALRPGDLFGVQGIKGEMPHLALVSHGCELIRVSMSKFREYADDDTYERVHKLLPTYATDYVLWRSFQKQNKWNNFKNEVIANVMNNAHPSNSSAVDRRPAPKTVSQKSMHSDWVTNTWSRRCSEGGSTPSRTTPLPKIVNMGEMSGPSKSPRPRRKGRTGLSSAASTRPNSRANSRAASRATSNKNSEYRPPTRQSMSNHDIKVLENRRASLPASRFVSTSHTLIHQSASRIHSAVDGALSVGGKGRYSSPASMSHLSIPDLASFKKPTYTGSRSWRELKS